MAPSSKVDCRWPEKNTFCFKTEQNEKYLIEHQLIYSLKYLFNIKYMTESGWKNISEKQTKFVRMDLKSIVQNIKNAVQIVHLIIIVFIYIIALLLKPV